MYINIIIILSICCTNAYSIESISINNVFEKINIINNIIGSATNEVDILNNDIINSNIDTISRFIINNVPNKNENVNNMLLINNKIKIINSAKIQLYFFAIIFNYEYICDNNQMNALIRIISNLQYDYKLRIIAMSVLFDNYKNNNIQEFSIPELLYRYYPSTSLEIELICKNYENKIRNISFGDELDGGKGKVIYYSIYKSNENLYNKSDVKFIKNIIKNKVRFDEYVKSEVDKLRSLLLNNTMRWCVNNKLIFNNAIGNIKLVVRSWNDPRLEFKEFIVGCDNY